MCVLSSNDGIIAALTAEAKALGLKRGDAFIKVKDTIERNRVAVFSGNLMLYAAESNSTGLSTIVQAPSCPLTAPLKSTKTEA